MYKFKEFTILVIIISVLTLYATLTNDRQFANSFCNKKINKMTTTKGIMEL